MSNGVTRRDLIAAAGLGTALVAVAARVSPAMPVGLGAVEVASDQAPLLLIDGSLSDAEIAAVRNEFAGLRPRVLLPDLVWEWRKDLVGLFANGIRGVAITRWDKALLFNGLAREAQLPVRQVRVGPNAFRTDIR